MKYLRDPFFWAFISMFALAGSTKIVSGRKLGRYPVFGILTVTVFALRRLLLVLPFIFQPRFEISGWHWTIVGATFALGLLFSSPALKIKPFTVADKHISLNSTGFYKIVRNPVDLGELLWCPGWSIMFRSIVGVVLVPFWWAGLLVISLIEEESLERELGAPYLEYKNRVRGRILPGLPI